MKHKRSFNISKILEENIKKPLKEIAKSLTSVSPMSREWNFFTANSNLSHEITTAINKPGSISTS